MAQVEQELQEMEVGEKAVKLKLHIGVVNFQGLVNLQDEVLEIEGAGKEVQGLGPKDNPKATKGSPNHKELEKEECLKLKVLGLAMLVTMETQRVQAIQD